MKVAEAIVKCLEKENVKTVFGYPGGAVLQIYEALRNSDIEHVLVRNEQASVHAASGYARAAYKTAVCIGTSGPGATNMITGIATAYMDSIPMVVITGQVERESIGKDAFQEADITGATAPFIKHNYLIKKAEDIPRVLTEAFYIASTGRPGPVLVDIPKDVQKEHIPFDYPEKVEIIGYKPTVTGHSGQIRKINTKLKRAKRPIIFAGGGVIRANAMKELTKFAEKARIPVVNTMMGIGAFPMDSKYYAGMVGSHGHNHTNAIIEKADLILILGARLSDRATKNFNMVKTNAEVIHVDIDPAEIGKVFEHTLPVVSDVKYVLKKLMDKARPLDTEAWLEEIPCFKLAEKVELTSTTSVNPRHVMTVFSDKMPDDGIITADVGQNQIWAAHGFEYRGERKYFTSGGLGTMGYSLSASIGAKLGARDKVVVSVSGDGGIQMLLSELGTLADINEPLVVVLFNNNCLGMVRELQDNVLGKGRNYGVGFGVSPDFVKIAEAYGLRGRRITSDDEIESAVEEALGSKQAFLLECMVSPEFETL